MKTYIYFLIILLLFLIINHFLPLREALDETISGTIKVQLIPNATDATNAANAKKAAAQTQANCNTTKNLLKTNATTSTQMQGDLKKAQQQLILAQQIIAQNAKDISSNTGILLSAKGSVSNYTKMAGQAADNIKGLKGSDGTGFTGLSSPGSPMTKAIQLFSGGQLQK